MTTYHHSLRPLVGAIFLALGLLAGCKKDDEAEPSDRELTLNSFEVVEINAGSNVVLTEGSTQKVKVRGREDLINKLRTGVDNGRWKVEFDGNVPDQDNVTIEVTMPRLRRLELAGPGAVTVINSFTYPDLVVVNTGSGSINLGVIATSVAVEVKGSGPVVLAGTAGSQTVRVTGSGSYQGFGLITSHTDVTVSGSGSAEVTANSTLRATVPGSGNVRYKGRPVITSSVTGSGRVIDSN
jgi:hypothetical protein